MNVQQDHVHVVVDGTTEGIVTAVDETSKGLDENAIFPPVSLFKEVVMLGQPLLGEELLCRHGRS